MLSTVQDLTQVTILIDFVLLRLLFRLPEPCDPPYYPLPGPEDEQHGG